MKSLWPCVAIALLIVACDKPHRATHNTLVASWRFKKDTGNVWLPASVPGAAHLDLLHNKLIPDPFVGTNEDSIRWVERENWSYEGVFHLSSADIAAKHIEIEFAGLDTYADVHINGHPVLSTENMFRSYQADITSWVHTGENKLEIDFVSPLTRNYEKYNSLPYRLPAGSEEGEKPVSSFTRKAAYQFGWDFAPRIVTMGIWRPIYLNTWSIARITNLHFIVNKISTEKAEYVVILEIESDSDQELALNLYGNKERIELKEGLNSIQAKLLIKDPKLWWPNSLGDAALYEIPAELWLEDKLIDSKVETLGVRTVELIQEADEIGESFYFLINGQKVFMKGANWSPLSSYPATIPDSIYHNRVRMVKDANMNMLRVWGGGIYESELFYDLCDKNGILIWQDFMFANSLYPSDSSFYINVKEEVTEQIIRLRNHPSIIHWNGNNEIEVAWENWGWQEQYGYSKPDSIEIWNNYQQIFHNLIPQVLKEHDPDRSYTSTSPISNWGTPANFNSASMHYWGVWHGRDRFADFGKNVGRFMAEYGFQSYPELSTFNQYASISDIKSTGNQALHQKSYVGNSLIIKESEHYFGTSSSIENFIINSQKTQAIAFKTAIEAHRLNKFKCGGTLFWQLNDCWPGPSWSVIDFYNKKKVAYYVVKDRYKPIILIPDADEDRFSIHVSNDLLVDLNGILKIEMFGADNDRLWVMEKPVEAPRNQTISVFRSNRIKLLDGMIEDNVYLKMTLEVDAEIVDIEKYYFVLPKKFQGQYDLIGTN